jgi:peptidoglycan/LPS O-acetylase OafA/YrhL
MSTMRHRLDIQGLRGMIVIPAFIYHMTGHWHSAIVLIDMFFTISGFVITCRLIQLVRTRSIGGYFYEFYKFRIKRILPASLTVLAIVTVVAHFVYLPARAHSVALDARSVLFFYANVRAGQQANDYMHIGEGTTPLLSYWSLSAEEQFYLLWPVVVLIILLLARRRWQPYATLMTVAATCFVASFGYGVWYTHTHTVLAYYDAPTRAWEFIAGGLLGIYASRGQLSRREGAGAAQTARSGSGRHTRRATLISWAGTLLLVAAVIVTPTSHGFPAPWAGAGVLGAAIVIFAGIDGRPKNASLTNRWIVWLGDVSFSFYLVHFPIMIIASSYLGRNKTMLYGFDTAATIAGTLLLFYFVELPGRQGLRGIRTWLRSGKPDAVLQTSLGCVTAAVVLFALTPQGTGFADAPPVAVAQQVDAGPSAPADVTTGPSTPTASASSSPAPARTVKAPTSFSDPDLVAPSPNLRDALARAISLDSWPAFPAGSELGGLPESVDRCNVEDAQHIPCVARPPGGTDSGHVAVAVGDSTMLAYWPMLRDSFTARGWTIVLYARTNCSDAWLTGEESSRTDFLRGWCQKYVASYRHVLDAWQPALVLLASGDLDTANLSNEDVTQQITSDDTVVDSASKRIYTRGLSAAVKAAQHVARRVAILSGPPPTSPATIPGVCAVAGSAPTDCLYRPGAVWFTTNSLDRQISASTGATYGDLLSYFCSSLLCPPVVDGRWSHSDQNHITTEYAAMLAPSFGSWLERSGLLG